MSNYHILTINSKRDQANVVFHIPVPATTNTVGVSLYTAVAQSVNASPISRVPWLQTDFPNEYTSISNGSIYEHIENVEYDANSTDLEKRIIVDNRFSTLSIKIPNALIERLKFWGLNRNVV